MSRYFLIYIDGKIGGRKFLRFRVVIAVEAKSRCIRLMKLKARSLTHSLSHKGGGGAVSHGSRLDETSRTAIEWIVPLTSGFIVDKMR
jgi:hypothetical protein